MTDFELMRNAVDAALVECANFTMPNIHGHVEVIDDPQLDTFDLTQELVKQLLDRGLVVVRGGQH